MGLRVCFSVAMKAPSCLWQSWVQSLCLLNALHPLPGVRLSPLQRDLKTPCELLRGDRSPQFDTGTSPFFHWLPEALRLCSQPMTQVPSEP